MTIAYLQHFSKLHPKLNNKNYIFTFVFKQNIASCDVAFSKLPTSKKGVE
jgi:hypothetical protein